MNSAIERLLTLRVNDIMRADVITVKSSDTMAQAAVVLDQADITGAPVVDDLGRCVGVLSSSDFVYRELVVEPHASPGERGAPNAVEAPASQGANKVETFMSPLVQTVSDAATIMNAARLLCKEHIHRLIVVDDEHRPVGILSSLDLVASMVAAVEE